MNLDQGRKDLLKRIGLLLILFLLGYLLGQILPINLLSIPLFNELWQWAQKQGVAAWATVILVLITGYYAREVAQQTKFSALNAKMPLIVSSLDLVLAPLRESVRRSKISLIKREHLNLFDGRLNMIRDNQPSLSFYSKNLFVKIEAFAVSYSKFRDKMTNAMNKILEISGEVWSERGGSEVVTLVKYEVFDPQNPSGAVVYIDLPSMILFEQNPQSINTFLGAFSPMTTCVLSSETKARFADWITDSEIERFKNKIRSELEKYTLWTDFKKSKDQVLDFIQGFERESNRMIQSLEDELEKNKALFTKL